MRPKTSCTADYGLFRSTLAGILVAGIVGCGNSSAPGTPAAGPDPVSNRAFSLANGCYALSSADRTQQIVKEGAGYRLAEAGSAAGTAFRMRPTALGKYLF